VVLHSIGVVLYADTIAIFVFCLFAFDVSRIVKLFAWQNLITNVLKDLLKRSSTGEFRLGLNSAQSKVWSEQIAKRSLKPSEKMTFTFWLIFGLSPDLRLGDSLSERLSQQVIMMCIHVCVCVQAAVCDYSPAHFIRCHFGDKNAIKQGHTDSDPTDDVTNVWCCSMEPDPNDSGLCDD